MLRIFKHLTPKDWMRILISLGLIAAQVWLDLKAPDYMSEITMLIQTAGSEMSDILQAGAYMLFCALGSLATSILVGFLAARVAAGFSQRLRALTFSKVADFSMEEIGHFSTASLITRSTNDITQIQMVIAMGLQVMIKAPILAVWAILKISGKSWQWTAATGCAVAFLLVMLLVIMLLAMPRFRKMQVLTDNLNRVTRENLTGLRVVRAYNAEDYQQAKFETANKDLMQNLLFANRTMAIMMPGMTMILSGISLAVYWIGAYLINNVTVTENMEAVMYEKASLFSDMMVFSAYAIQVIMAFMMMTMIFIILPRAAVSAKRINEVLDTVPTILDGTQKQQPAAQGTIQVNHVSFRYPGAADYVLQDISFTAKQGETVAFIGATGSGKTTLINLIPRFYDATDGEVLVDGVNVRDYKMTELRNRIGYVSQRAVLFSGSVTSNVAFGDNGGEAATESDVRDAVSLAQSADFVEKMEGQYEAAVAQGGSNLSGGQKQRISIARAIARKPEIFIFDDSFSALDYKTDKVLRKALNEKTTNATKLIVAQRIGTIKNADQIIVLDEGRIVGCGTHETLLKTCDVYREIAYSQLSKEELEDGE